MHAAELRLEHELQPDPLIVVVVVERWRDCRCERMLFGPGDHEDEPAESDVESKLGANSRNESKHAELVRAVHRLHELRRCVANDSAAAALRHELLHRKLQPVLRDPEPPGQLLHAIGD